ncbi:MAG: aminomethyl-transferring glycine dehydrogenase subunit GcvPA [Candidatus Eisenbacteria sp.]|nr:aminomethyl-transferring glycine dehydrogenase subunit GcvPA [Candidatus Eisenbacteria bacterium]
MSRYVQHSENDRAEMLDRLRVSRVEDLWKELPREKVLTRPLGIPARLSELEVVELLTAAANDNVDPGKILSFLGGGVYDHFIPAVVPWVAARPEFATAYTPYQAEVSQGTLQSTYEFQSLICELTGMDVANASMYDGASAVAEAALTAVRVTRRKRVLVSEAIHPSHMAVLRSYARGGRMEVVTLPISGGRTDLDAVAGTPDAACMIVQNPNFFGVVEPVEALAERAHEAGMLALVSCDPISLSILASPGELGADIAVGEGQSLGSPMAFGGPLLGFFACRDRFLRQMPGRVVGRTEDTDGNTCYVMTLQTREQHIRREKATSNICTNQALLALAATVYLSALGKDGFRQVGELCVQKSHYAAGRICEIPGFSLRFPEPFFKEFVVRCSGNVGRILKHLREKDILGGVPLGDGYPELEDCLLVAVTEKRTREEIDHWVEIMDSAARQLESSTG